MENTTAPKPLHVLLVEDSPSDAALLQENILLSGARDISIRVAKSLHEAAAHLRGDHTDVVLLDLTLPDSSGLDTVRWARRVCSSLPVIVLTGVDDEKTGNQAVRMGVQDYLVKGQSDGRTVIRAIHYSIERKTFEEALRRSEENFKLIATNTPDHILVQDTDLRYVWVLNPQLGLTEKDMIGKTDFDFLKEEDAINLTNIKKKVIETGELEQVNLPLASSDGSMQYFDGLFVPRRNSTGEVDGIIGYFKNVTEQKKMDEALRQSEERYRTLFNGMSEGFALHEMIFDEDGNPCDYRFLEVNPAFESLTGLKRQDVVGRTVLQVLPENESYWVETYGRVTLTGEPAHFEQYNATLGCYYDVMAYRPAEGQFACIFLDVTARKRAEEALRQVHDKLEIRVQERTAELSRTNLKLAAEIGERKRAEDEVRAASRYSRSLIEAGLDPMVTISKNGKITDVNKATELATGVPRERLVGSDFSSYFTEPAKARESYRKAIAEGQVRDYPLTIRHVSGRRMDVFYNATIYSNEAGQVQGVLASARDITQRKAEEKRREVTNALLDLFAHKTSAKEYLDAVVEVIRKWSDCQAIGVRMLGEGDDISYETCLGFEPGFMELENHLSLSRDNCLCLRTIKCQAEDQERSLMTSGGSFRCDNSFKFLEGLSPKQQDRYRGNCIKYGFVSLAVVPIKYRDEVLGIIHLADYRPSHFSPSTVEFIESMTPLIGEAIQRFRAEMELHRVNRTLRMISECNEALVQVADEPKLIEAVCRIMYDAGGYRMVWVGFAEQDAARTVRPIASVGFEEGYLERAVITWADNEKGRGPTGTAIRTGEVSIAHDFSTDPRLAPWRQEALKRGYLSSIALPLRAGGNTFGVLTIYAEHTGVFDSAQVELLGELADDLAFGILALRAHAERDHAMEALEQRTDQLRALTLEVMQTEQRERRRLAQILHDHLQQLLVGAKMRVAMLRREGTGAQEIRQMALDVDNLIGQSIEASRTLTAELSPPILHDGGLAPALKWLGRWMKDKHGLSVELFLPENVADITGDIAVLMFQSVRELLFNTVKHAGTMLARVDYIVDGNRVRVVVSDKGMGFDPSQLTVHGGQVGGFGLFSVKERLDIMGGSLEIDSAPGSGSRMTIVSPQLVKAKPLAVAPELPAASPALAEPKVPLKARGSLERKIRVLLVDDHVIMRQGVGRLLREEADMEVVGEAANGETALKMVRKLMPDIVIMDINMPGMGGVEATRVMRAEFPQVIVIGHSMFEEPERAAQMKEAGAVEYITKSDAPESLVAVVRKCYSARKGQGTGHGSPVS
jgi:PAS domain S-box-containing protein